jgi:hypothetical protein
MSTIYTVTFTNKQTGEREISRYFQTLRAARNLAKWLNTTNFATCATIYKGGAGGEIVK